MRWPDTGPIVAILWSRGAHACYCDSRPQISVSKDRFVAALRDVRVICEELGTKTISFLPQLSRLSVR